MKTRTQLLAHHQVARDTMEFRFAKPDGFEYIAGNNADFFLIDPPETDEEGNKRTFSLVSTPADDYLAIASRMRDTAFKRVLKGLPAGTDLEVDGPYGDFVLHQKAERPAVFLIGGIGITPVHSIILDALATGKPHQMTLLYANHSLADAAYHGTFQDLADLHDNFTYVPVVTKEEPAGWSGEFGRIDEEMLRRHVPKFDDTVVYLAGPESMVKAMRLLAGKAGADADLIRTEEFPGY